MTDQEIDDLLRTLKPVEKTPEQFTRGVDEVLQRLPKPQPQRQEKKKRGLYVSVSAASLAFCILGSGFLSPAMADVLREVPGIGSIFAQFKDPVLQKMEEQGLMAAIQKTAVDRNITLTIKEVFYDGARLAIGYELTMPKDHRPIPATQPGQDSPLNFKATLNGESGRIQYMADVEQQPNGENTYAGKIDMFVDIIGKPASPLLHLDITEIDGIPGNWNFRLPLVQDTVQVNTRTFQPLLTSRLQDVEVTVEEISFTPATTQFVFKKKGPKESLGQVNVSILDDNGAYLGGVSAGEPPVEEPDGTFSMIEKASLKAMDQVPERFKVLLREQGTRSLQQHATDKRYAFDAKGSFPQTIPMGRDRKLTITDISFAPDKTLVQIETQGDSMLHMQTLVLESQGDMYARMANPKGVPGKPGSFVLEYPALPADKKVQLTSSVDEKDWDNPWSLIEVPLLKP